MSPSTSAVRARSRASGPPPEARAAACESHAFHRRNEPPARRRRARRRTRGRERRTTDVSHAKSALVHGPCGLRHVGEQGECSARPRIARGAGASRVRPGSVSPGAFRTHSAVETEGKPLPAPVLDNIRACGTGFAGRSGAAPGARAFSTSRRGRRAAPRAQRFSTTVQRRLRQRRERPETHKASKDERGGEKDHDGPEEEPPPGGGPVLVRVLERADRARGERGPRGERLPER